MQQLTIISLLDDILIHHIFPLLLETEDFRSASRLNKQWHRCAYRYLHADMSRINKHSLGMIEDIYDQRDKDMWLNLHERMMLFLNNRINEGIPHKGSRKIVYSSDSIGACKCWNVYHNAIIEIKVESSFLSVLIVAHVCKENFKPRKCTSCWWEFRFDGEVFTDVFVSKESAQMKKDFLLCMKEFFHRFSRAGVKSD